MVPPPLMNRPAVKCIAIMGATATGKSALGIDLAIQFGGEVVSMDSRQVYRGMDIGTGKVTQQECRGIPHHLLDILDPGEKGSAVRHAKLAGEAIDTITSNGNVPFLVGGTGLYFEALLQPFIDVEITPEQQEAVRAQFESRDTLDLYAQLRSVDPERAKRLSSNDRVRVMRALEIYVATGRPMSEYLVADAARSTLRALKLVLTVPRQRLRERIDRRTRAMYEAGWVEEVKILLDEGVLPGSPGMRGLGYEEISSAILAGKDPKQTVDEVVVRTQQYAKRQETYFRKFHDGVWLDVSNRDFAREAADRVRSFLS